MPPSHFIWYELLTTDAAAAQRFYSEVIGWTVQVVRRRGWITVTSSPRMVNTSVACCS